VTTKPPEPTPLPPGPDTNLTATQDIDSTGLVTQVSTNTPTSTPTQTGQELDKSDRYQSGYLWIIPLVVLLIAAAAGLIILIRRHSS